jgi:hypothetical protein
MRLNAAAIMSGFLTATVVYAVPHGDLVKKDSDIGVSE